VSTPQPTANWKDIILAGSDWPETFEFPQVDPMPEGSECILESTYFNEHWEWELWRQPDGNRYFIKAWPMDEGKFSNPNTPGAALTVAETFQFLMTNWMPQIVLDDHFAQHGQDTGHLRTDPRRAGLN
jgi:hypothetical protein